MYNLITRYNHYKCLPSHSFDIITATTGEEYYDNPLFRLVNNTLYYRYNYYKITKTR